MDWETLRERLEGLERRSLRSADLRRAAVLVPLFVRCGVLHLVFTRRPETLKAHPGQVSFPGGKLSSGENSLECALREAEEELGIPPGEVEVLGRSHDVVVATGFSMTPWLGRIREDLQLVPNPSEVARVFAVPWPELADPEQTPFCIRSMEFEGQSWQVPFFEWREEVIWGATGRVLVDLLELIGRE